MTDIDFTGIVALGEVLDVLDRLPADFSIARAGARVRTSLERGGLLDRIGKDRLFGTVGEAVAALAATDGPAGPAGPGDAVREPILPGAGPRTGGLP